MNQPKENDYKSARITRMSESAVDFQWEEAIDGTKTNQNGKEIEIGANCGSINMEILATPPTKKDDVNKYITTINASFDEVWSKLIQYSGKTFFAIDNYEKDSGLITLSFGASRPERFITGGHWEYSDSRPAKQIDFSGDYVEYLSRYGNGNLNGKMNIVVTKLEKNKTKVRVNAKYIFTAQFVNRNLTWSFETGNCDTLKLTNIESTAGTGAMRSMCPTYNVEDTIINVLNEEFK